MAIQFDQDELDGLVDFLIHGSGRIAASVVPGSAAGRELTVFLREEFGPEAVRVAKHLLDPVALGEEAQVAAHDGKIFIIPLDGRHRVLNEDTLLSEEEEADLWRRLNYQREKVAAGEARTLFLLDERADRFSILAADDLREWVRFFRFPEAVPPTETNESTHDSPLETIHREVLQTANLSYGPPDILRKQLRRAREAGLPETEVTHSYALPLFLSLANHADRDEALKIWKDELRRGEALVGEPEPLVSLYLRELPSVLNLLGCLNDALTIVDWEIRRLQAQSNDSWGLRASLSDKVDILQELGRGAEALLVAEEVVELDRQSIEHSPRDGFRQLFLTLDIQQLAIAHLYTGDFGQAVTALEESTDLARQGTRHPQLGNLAQEALRSNQRILAHCFTELGRHGAAVAAYRQAILLESDLGPKADKARLGRDWSYLAEALRALGRLEEARHAEKQARRYGEETANPEEPTPPPTSAPDRPPPSTSPDPTTADREDP